MSSLRLLLIVIMSQLPATVPFGTNDYWVIDSQEIYQPNGAKCVHHYAFRNLDDKKTVSDVQSYCKTYGESGPPSVIYGRLNYVPIRFSDISIFFQRLSEKHNRHATAKAITFFAVSNDLCMQVKFKSKKFSTTNRYIYSDIIFTLQTSETGVTCPTSKTVRSVNQIVCVRDNCTFPKRPTPPTVAPPSAEVVAVASSADTTKDCMKYLGDDVVTAERYNNHRLWVIVAGVACNLVSMAFLAGMIHYCLKYRHLKRHCRLGTSSLIGTASPAPAVRHLGSTSGNQLIQFTPSGSVYPDYQYSSIARRKLKAQQQRNPYGRHMLDDETMSYRSDNTRLLMPGSNGGVPGHHVRHGSMSGSTLQRHGSGAVSPPRGWGHNEAPSTPGSIRRHGSISAVSMTSSGYPRRNGTLPPPPPPIKAPQSPATPPPPPPPLEHPGGTVIF